MGSALRDKTVLIIGRGSGIARAVTLLARSEGARVVVAGRGRTKLADAYADLGDSGISAEVVDITDDASIAALADRVGSVDHVVSTASARARGKLADLQRQNLLQSFDTKVIGPTMLAKHFVSQINPGGSFVLFSGVHAFKHNVGYLGVGITNGAVDFLSRWLAVELAPIRVNARRHRYRGVGRYGCGRQTRLLRAHRSPQSDGTDRDAGGDRGRGAVRDDQYLHDRHDAEGGRRRTAYLAAFTRLPGDGLSATDASAV
jgi:NAD(P)-dependent dehydrogenase (short-subunit alcohol dehydrogenase family)